MLQGLKLKRNGPTEVRPLVTALFDDLNDPVRGGIDQHWAIVHYRVSILGHAVLMRHVIVSNSARRQIRADTHFAFVAIRRNTALRDVAAEARSRIVGDATSDSSNAGANRGSDRPANDRTGDGACRRACCSTVLRVRSQRKRKRGGNRRAGQ